MSFALLAPLGLAALAALVVPIVVHLVRRLELRTTEFAALRWISERIRPRRRLRFERPWLLLLRLALLALLALLLARPVLTQPPGAQASRVLVAPGSDLAAARRAVSSRTADWRWLAPGFPADRNAGTVNERPGREPAARSGCRVAGAARRSRSSCRNSFRVSTASVRVLSHAIDWHVVPGKMPSDEPAAIRTERSRSRSATRRPPKRR